VSLKASLGMKLRWSMASWSQCGSSVLYTSCRFQFNSGITAITSQVAAVSTGRRKSVTSKLKGE